MGIDGWAMAIVTVLLLTVFWQFVFGLVMDPCPYCKHWMAKDATVCGHCGRDRPPNTAPARPNPLTFRPWLAYAAIVVLAAAAMLFIWRVT